MSTQPPTDADERLANAALIVELYTTKLDVAARANHDDHRFISGVTHAQAALARVRRALDGETDPVALGLQDAPTKAPESEPDLFGATP